MELNYQRICSTRQQLGGAQYAIDKLGAVGGCESAALKLILRDRLEEVSSKWSMVGN